MSLKKPKKEELSQLKEKVNPFLGILKKSQDQKINEADTRTIITDLLSDVFDYDKYFDITAEFMIKNTFADYVIVTDDIKQIVIEAKQITTKLNNNHVKQAVDYAAHEGIKWAILTNGVTWRLYRVTLGTKIDYSLFFEFSLDDLNDRALTDMFYITKESIKNGILEDYWKYRQALNPPTLLKILLSDDIINRIRRELKNKSGYKVTADEVTELLITQIIRPEYVKKSADWIEEIDEFEMPDLSTLTPMVNDTIVFILEKGYPVSVDEIKTHLESKGHEFKSLGSIMRSLNIRFGTHFTKNKDDQYTFSDEAKEELKEAYNL